MPAPMAWVLALFLVVTSVLTLVAWRFGRKSRRASTGPRVTEVDSWLIEHYQLPSLGACLDVQEAVRDGRAVADPALRPAAHGLAAELLSGRLRDPHPATRVFAGVYGLVGVLFLGTGLAHGGRGSSFDIWMGTGWVLSASIWVWGSAKLPRRKIERALQLNKSDTDRI